MKEYEILYTNLFHWKDKPEVKVMVVLAKSEMKFMTFDVVVDMTPNHSYWYIEGNEEFEHMTKDERDIFIEKMYDVEKYYMSNDDYEIIDVYAHKEKTGMNISVAVAFDIGDFAVVDITMDKDRNVAFKTDWEYLTKETISSFVDEVLEFIDEMNK